MDDERRRSDDVWRGEVNARLTAMERRVDQADRRDETMSSAVNDIKVNLGEMRQLLTQTVEIVQAGVEDREQERSDFIQDLKKTLAGKRAMPMKWAIAIIAPLIVTIVGGLVVLAASGAFGH